MSMPKVRYPFITQEGDSYSSCVLPVEYPAPMSVLALTTTYEKHLIQYGSNVYTYYLDEALGMFDVDPEDVLALIYEAYLTELVYED